MYEDINKKISGFSLIETLVGITITAVICSTLFLGIAQTKLYLDSIRVKDKAFQELRNYTNELKSMVAAGVTTFPSNPQGGKQVVLKRDSDDNSIIKGNLFKNITRAANSGQYSVYYNISTYITWDKYKFFSMQDEILDTLSFNTYQIQFQIQ
mgnify:FL=1|jgi:type II secretory pathway pseudopilin PulG